MGTLCKLGRHKWEYYDQVFEVEDPPAPRFTSSSGYVVKGIVAAKFNCKVRICNKCMKKQRNVEIYGNIYGHEYEWRNFDYYTKEEKSEINIKNII
jgi:hypothetical protein